MSWKKGTQWKSSWNRARQIAPGSQFEQMWFMNLADGYQAANPAPFPFQGTTFWMGLVTKQFGTVEGITVFSEISQQLLGSGIYYRHYSTYTPTTLFPYYTEAAALDSGGSPENNYPASKYLNSGVTLGGSVLVSLITVQPESLGSRVRVWMDGGLRYSEVVLAVVPAANKPRLFHTTTASGNHPFHGFAGGTVIPTDDEIYTWFQAVRSNLEIQEIPGKTTDLISATSVAPLAPALLPNGSTGQDFATVGGAPTNSLDTVIFNYS